MTPRLSIAHADAHSPRANYLVEALRAHGYEVVQHGEARSCLAALEASLYLVGSTLADGSSGLDLLEALRRTGRSAPILLRFETPDFGELRRAVELGATDVIFGSPEIGVLLQAIERAGAKAGPAPRPDTEPRAHDFEQRYAADASAVGRAAREVSAFLVNEGVAGAHRVRIASALAELVDNSCRHGYGRTGGEIAVYVALRGVRVLLTVEDGGGGFDVARHRLERIPPALPSRRGLRAVPAGRPSTHSGLGRIERLCEELTIHSGKNGTRAELCFELTPVRFEDEPEHLSQTDFLDPERARSLIAALRKGSDLSGIAPDMALTVGRILGGLDAEVRPPRRGA